MVAWAQREPGKVYPAWWADEKRVLIRRIHNRNFVHPELREGLPEGVIVKRETLSHAGDVFSIYIDKQRVYYANNLKTNAADAVLAWIEEYRKESEDIMGISTLGLGLLKDLAATHGTGLLRTEINVHGGAIAALARKSLIKAKGDRVYITEAGMSELLGLPEFDEPTSPPTQEQASPPPPLPRERGEDSGVGRLTIEIETDADTPAAEELVDGAAELSKAIKRAVNAGESIPEKPVMITFGDGFELADFVEHCGAEIETMGGISIKLNLTPSLLMEIYPPLKQLLDGLNAIGAPTKVWGDLQILVEGGINVTDDELRFGLT